VKEAIHPKYDEVEARCACGNTFMTRSTKPELHLEICSACHPFFTGRQKLIDTEGRVERFSKKFGLQTSEQRQEEDHGHRVSGTSLTDRSRASARLRRLPPRRSPSWNHTSDRSASCCDSSDRRRWYWDSGSAGRRASRVRGARLEPRFGHRRRSCLGGCTRSAVVHALKIVCCDSVCARGRKSAYGPGNNCTVREK
jgi:large subunit ribosomal protein L31